MVSNLMSIIRQTQCALHGGITYIEHIWDRIEISMILSPQHKFKLHLVLSSVVLQHNNFRYSSNDTPKKTNFLEIFT